MIWRKKKLFDVVSGTVDGKAVSYSFTSPVSEDRAKREFEVAAARRLPTGSVILIA